MPLKRVRARKLSPERSKRKPTTAQLKATSNNGRIVTWEDDPMSTDAALVSVAAPEGFTGAFSVVISGKPIKPAVYKEGSEEFRYWNAFDALNRAAKFWRDVVHEVDPDGDWYQQSGSPLSVDLVHGNDLNAYYDRERLSFFRASVSGRTVYSGESPDVLAHELGHAVLDAIRPALWDVLGVEFAAFHEAFGDISSICSALQLASLRRAAIEETRPNFYRSSRVSRLAEQLGWAIRQVRTDSTEPDCLRNAVNSLYYQSPHKLPPEAPSSTLSSESHSFSRVFTGAFFATMANMLELDPQPSADALLDVTHDLALVLVIAAKEASIVPDFYSEIALRMLDADQRRFAGRYASAIKSAFVKRGILSLEIPTTTANRRSFGSRRPGSSVGTMPGHARGAVSGTAIALETQIAAPAEVNQLAFAGRDFGLEVDEFYGQAAAEDGLYRHVVAFVNAGDRQPTAEEAANLFLEGLFRRGKVDLDAVNGRVLGKPIAAVSHPLSRRTHALVRNGLGGVSLVRRLFE
jgi:hypothetical protein